MGSTSRKKHLRGNRKPPNPEPKNKAKFVVEAGRVKPNCGSRNGEQLEEALYNKLHLFYGQVLSRLVGMGYDQGLALRAVLRSGFTYGSADVVTNIFDNVLAHLRGAPGGCGAEGCQCESEYGDEEDDKLQDGFKGFSGFADLRHLEEYTLGGMITLMQKYKPKLSKVDAMWCLLMCDLHVGRACSLDITSHGVSSTYLKPAGILMEGRTCVCGDPDCDGGYVSSEVFPRNAEVSLQSSKKSGMPAPMKSMLRKNMAAFAAGYQATAKCSQNYSHAETCQCCSVSEGSQQVVVSEVSGKERQQHQGVESQSDKKADDVNALLVKFRDMLVADKTDSVTDEQKDEMINIIVRRVNKLQRHILERREWAQETALQAAGKLSADLSEFEVLKVERVETLKQMQGKQSLDESTMKRLADMESALRKTSGQVDRANLAVKRLEANAAESKAETEAAKLSESESIKTYRDIVKREKKTLKKRLAWEKQEAKMKNELANETLKLLQSISDITQVNGDQKDAEVKFRQEREAKELALAIVQEERRLREYAEANDKRTIESLQLNIEIDFQRKKDDMQRLEQELSRLKASLQAIELQLNAFPGGKSKEPIPQSNTLVRSIHDLNEKMNSLNIKGNSDRVCRFCMENEVSIVFLPCAHKVLCANCNNNYGKTGRDNCPCCRMPIEQMFRVYGPDA